jgi:cytochrome c-type biogenesis protein
MEASAFGLAAAFTAGIVSFVSPCVLPLVPAYVSYLTGQGGAEAKERDVLTRLAMLKTSGSFVLGFSAVFISLGAGATALGQLLLRYRYEANLAAGALVILFGLLMLGLARGMPWFGRDLRFLPVLRSGGTLSSFLLGLAFGFGWTPCIGPVLGAILTMTAVQYSVGGGMALLATYAAGLGVPFLVTAMFTREMTTALKRFRRAGMILQYMAGGIMVVMGIAMITGHLSRFSFWLLEAFPLLGRIG